MAWVGLFRLASSRPGDWMPIDKPASVEFGLARAAMLVGTGDAPGAADCVAAALDAALPGNAGWLVPIEPLLGVQREPETWRSVVAQLRHRAQ